MATNPTYKDISKLGTNAKVFYNYFSQNGYSPIEISGLLGNFIHESGGGSSMDINLSAIGDNGAAIGAAQWRDGRRTNLEKFAKQKGTSIYDPLTQAEFVHNELSGSYSGVRQKLKSATDSKSAMEVVMNYYERPADVHRKPSSESYTKRLLYANNILGSPTKSTNTSNNYWFNDVTIPKKSGELSNLSDNFYGFVHTLKQKFPKLRITSGYRPGAKTKQGNLSRHGKGEAIDIGAEHEDVYDYLWNNQEGLSLMKKYGVGILDERSKAMQNKTGASGAHFHLGMDSTLVPKIDSRAKELGFDLNNPQPISVPEIVDSEQDSYNYGWQSQIDPNSDYGKALIDNLKSQTALQDAQKDAMWRDTQADERKLALIQRQQEKDFLVAQTLATKLNFVERNNNKI